VIIRRQGDWLAAKVGDELVMMSAAKDLYLGLTEVGARIWELIETPTTLEAICARLQAEFDVTAQACRADVEAFLAELQVDGAVSIDQN